MEQIWGVLIAVVGLFMLVSGLTKSNFIVYRLMIAHSKMLWGENVHLFYQAVGAVLIILGILVSFSLYGSATFIIPTLFFVKLKFSLPRM
ncbi:hypothetical protein [Thermococcus sp.]|uniref:hypothetical protein n=1 Tax=Thermococcus sp. TaxID=35749 RepID=UPI00198C5561|nr:hypothetical protein [Thermococcus sp.]MBC7094935.1 hypothetical protein [Thermococcus sp.]